MGHFDRAPARAVRRHRREPVVGLFDPTHDRPAAFATRRAGICPRALESESPRLHEVARLVVGLHELRELGLPHRPPGNVRDVDEALREIAPDERAVGRVRQRRVEAPHALEPRLESGLALAAPRVPGLEVVEDGADLHERVDGGVLERHEPRSGRIARDERRAVESEDCRSTARAARRSSRRGARRTGTPSRRAACRGCPSDRCSARDIRRAPRPSRFRAPRGRERPRRKCGRPRPRSPRASTP